MTHMPVLLLCRQWVNNFSSGKRVGIDDLRLTILPLQHKGRKGRCMPTRPLSAVDGTNNIGLISLAYSRVNRLLIQVSSFYNRIQKDLRCCVGIRYMLAVCLLG